MPTTNLLQGTLDLFILKALALTGMHGLAISHRIAQITNGTFQCKARVPVSRALPHGGGG